MSDREEEVICVLTSSSKHFIMTEVRGLFMTKDRAKRFDLAGMNPGHATSSTVWSRGSG